MTHYRIRLVEYIKKNLKKGYTIESLKWALVKQGYAKVIVENAIVDANKELAKSVPVFKEKPQIKYEILDAENKPVAIKKSFLKRIFKRFFR
jgi:hypothetical protein